MREKDYGIVLLLMRILIIKFRNKFSPRFDALANAADIVMKSIRSSAP